ncbi:MAG TPA: hypothetical protein VGI95_22110 [Caulobacteraceae bacterium]|jgi:hypothetical protein
MTLQNRVTPLGDIVAVPERGMFTGNRGILHDPRTRTLLTRRWTSAAWLICLLERDGVRRTVMGPGSWTELFFLDEATALAAGHRPCFFCRRAAARDFQAKFPTAAGRPSPKAGEVDQVLHAQRLASGKKRLHPVTTPAADLPDGAMVLQAGAPHLVVGGQALPWSPGGYAAPTALLAAAQLITPPATVAVLRAGYRAQLHPTAALYRQP